ncbi:hypothetical protein PHMEG_00020228 [Phytophthora megakarya]|uniref:Reverse transcriptase RNase H-like domain-containing protein n=1 Tax=Phytophthora megakarya TaxID=4795 RepID=A0A225VPM3_9STRA|nr:hypothetical protein PHMEG_00020228 [Phytophthora megakarya]
MIYQRMLDNALWGLFSLKVDEIISSNISNNSSSWKLTNSRTKFHADPDMFTTNEPDESTLIPVFLRRSFVDDICFGGTTFDDCLNNLNKFLNRFEGCRISVSFTKRIFFQSKVDFLSHEISPEGIKADGKKMAAITELSFPKTKRGMQQFLGALNYYSRFIQDFAVFGAALYQLKDVDFETEGNLSATKESFRVLQHKVAEAPILRNFDDNKCTSCYMQMSGRWMHDDKLHPVRFCGRVLKDAEMNYHSAEKEVLALLLLLKVCYTQLAGKTLHRYTRYFTLAWVHKSKSLFGRAVQFAVLLSPWQLEVQKIREKDCLFLQLLQSTITNFVDLDESLALVAPPTKSSPSTQMEPSLLYAQLPHEYDGLVVSFDGSAKTEKSGGYGSCSWRVWKLPEWHE